MTARFRLAFQPVPEKDKLDTSLRYTDILFGFVIRELFIRLQSWMQLDPAVRLHLIVGTTLVLGSWIGYRRSLHRSGYQVKFFNLPLFRFLLDQLMLILYFRIAVLTQVGGTGSPGPLDLARGTTKLVACVFVLYLLWDLLGLWMSMASTRGLVGEERASLYPEQPVSVSGIMITAVVMALLASLWLLDDCVAPNVQFLATTALLLLYRWAKETRTSWQSPPKV